MLELLSKLNGDDLVGLCMMAAFALVAVAWAAATQWRRVRIAELNIELKQQLLERGMSAAEIAQVVAAGENGRRGGGFPWGLAGPARLWCSDTRAALTENMVQAGYDAAEIERVLRAWGTGPGAPPPPARHA